jgi:hypothetical protein
VQELAFLKQLKEQHLEIQQNMIIVISNIESVEQGRDERIASFREALNSVLGFCPQLVLTSWPRFQRGVLENKAILLNQSGIPELKKILQRNLVANEQTRLTVRQAHDTRYRSLMADMVKQAIDQRKTRMATIRDGQRRSERDLCNMFSHIHNSLKKRIDHYNNL